ncbi:MAG: hypothetical protein AB7O43_15220 [Hyphomicrobiaceae bacterium]
MIALGNNEFALIELMAMHPVEFLPPMQLSIARKLAKRGLIDRKDDRWLPTARGLAMIHRTLH